MPVDILIYAVIAGGLVMWLRSILGTRHGEERDRPNPFAAPPDAVASPVSGAAKPGDKTSIPAEINNDIRAGLERNMFIAADAALEKTLQDVAQADRSFSPARFLRGAQDAFVMIVEAFAAGDKDGLSYLLAPKVHDVFTGVIDDRAVRGEKSSVEIHAVRRAEIVSAKLDKRMAYITVRFVSDETNVLRNSAGIVLEGNPERISETIDVWTFGRDVKSRDPAWLLYETRDENAAASGDGNTVPDSK